MSAINKDTQQGLKCRRVYRKFKPPECVESPCMLQIHQFIVLLKVVYN